MVNLGSWECCRALLLLLLLLLSWLLLLRLLVQRVSARKLLLQLQDADQRCNLPPQLCMLPCHHASLQPLPAHLPTSHPYSVLNSLEKTAQKAIAGGGMSAL